MAKFLKSYKAFSTKYPMGSQAFEAGVLMGAGDLIAQVFIERKPLKNLNLVRTGQFTLVGAFFVGPSLKIWYTTLDKYFGSSGKRSALIKVTLDQVVFAPVFLPGIMTLVNFLQTFSLKETIYRVKQEFSDVLINNYKFWPGAQLLIFYFVPLRRQVVVVQFVAVIWNTYLSWRMNKDYD